MEKTAVTHKLFVLLNNIPTFKNYIRVYSNKNIPLI